MDDTTTTATAITCPSCHEPIVPDAIFCPRCGKQLKEAPLSTSVFTQTTIYLVSILLPPLGLWPGIKYFRHSDPKAERVGMAAIVLTVLSTTITIWLTFQFLNVYLNTLNTAQYGF